MMGAKRESTLLPKILFRFVMRVASLSQIHTDPAVMELSHPAGNGFAGWNDTVLFYLREHVEAKYEEATDWVEGMKRVQFLLGLRRGEFPRLRP